MKAIIEQLESLHKYYLKALLLNLICHHAREIYVRIVLDGVAEGQ